MCLEPTIALRHVTLGSTSGMLKFKYDHVHFIVLYAFTNLTSANTKLEDMPTHMKPNATKYELSNNHTYHPPPGLFLMPMASRAINSCGVFFGCAGNRPESKVCRRRS